MKALDLSKEKIATNTIKTKTKTEQYAGAQEQMKLGKRLVIGGFILSIMGIIAYCVTNFNMTLNQKYNGILVDNSGALLIPTLATIGIGTLVWLIGSFIHLKGAMNSDPSKTDF